MDGLHIGPHYRLVPARYGSMLVNRNDIFMGQSFLHYGECCEAEIAVLQRLIAGSKPGIVVEVGANMGVHTVPMAAALQMKGRTLLALEPQPVLFQQLCANLALNGRMNVRALPYACGAEEGEVSFRRPDYQTAGNFGEVAMRPADGSETLPGMERVPCRRLDDLVGNEAVALLKLDVEGYELRVLEGADCLVQRELPALYLENDRLEGSEALIRWLFGRGYRLWWHLAPAYNPQNFLGNARNIYGDVVAINMIALHPSSNAMVDGLPEVRRPDDHPLRWARFGGATAQEDWAPVAPPVEGQSSDSGAQAQRERIR